MHTHALAYIMLGIHTVIVRCARGGLAHAYPHANTRTQQTISTRAPSEHVTCNMNVVSPPLWLIGTAAEDDIRPSTRRPGLMRQHARNCWQQTQWHDIPPEWYRMHPTRHDPAAFAKRSRFAKVTKGGNRKDWGHIEAGSMPRVPTCMQS